MLKNVLAQLDSCFKNVVLSFLKKWLAVVYCNPELEHSSHSFMTLWETLISWCHIFGEVKKNFKGNNCLTFDTTNIYNKNLTDRRKSPIFLFILKNPTKRIDTQRI